MPATLKKPRRTRKPKSGSNGHPPARTVADLVRELGDIPANRILLHPAPGTATEADLLRAIDGDNKVLCELVNGTLVEKPMGYQESRIAAILIRYLLEFVESHDIGFVTGADGPYRMKLKNVRLPDVTYISWNRFASREDADKPNICPVSPDLVVEVLSESNTKKEIEKKQIEYFETGVRLLWIVDPRKKIVTVKRPDGTHTVLDHKGKLSGEDVLPGFKLEISKFL
jgi:Uma2 family endonuclease